MQAINLERFRAVITGMAKVYEREIDSPLLDVYWLALRDWTIGDFEVAAAYLMQTSEFMPRPAAFVKLRQAGRPTAGEAWAAVLGHCAGSYRNGEGIDDGGPIDQAVAALGGYRAVAMHNNAFLHALERRFAEHYACGVEVADVRVTVPQIISELRPRILGNGPRKLLDVAADSVSPEWEHDAGSDETAVGAV